MRALLPLLLLSVACTSPVDTQQPVEDASEPVDSGPLTKLDAGVVLDAAEDGGIEDAAPDGGSTEDGGMDATAPDDGGAPLPQEMVPGSHVQVAEARIDIGATFTDVTALLGPGVRTAAMGARSYDWTLSDGVMLTVWFANTNLDDDDDPPNDVDGTDAVLWILAQGFAGTTPEMIGVGSTQPDVETAYGAAPHTVPIPNPAGTLAQYFTTGLLVAYAGDDTVRNITICRAYVQAPDGEIDPGDARVVFATGEIQGIRSLVQRGTDDGDVLNRLGAPDGRGVIRLGGQDLDTFSYGFIGVEVFFLDNDDRTLFVTVHSPFYGTTNQGQGIGSTRTEVESFLTNRNYGAGTPATNPALICYAHNSGDPMVGVTYDANDLATTFTVPIPLDMCP